MKGRWAVIVTAALLVLSACGSSAPTKVEAAKQAQEHAAQARQQAAAAKRVKESAIYKECHEVVGPLDNKLLDLDSRLSVGLLFADYSKAVGSAKVAYDELIRTAKARGGISKVCINRVALPLQTGLNAYTRAYNVWNNCTQSYSCTFDKGSLALKQAQAKWAKASRLVNRADSALTKLQPRS